MDENVSKAVEWADEFLGSPDCKTPTYWQTIRARLLSQDAEIDELVRALTMCADRAKRAESHLAAADALLLECTRYLNPHHYPDTIKRIDAHLSENGHVQPQDR